MKRLIVALLLALGCSAEPRRVAAPSAPLAAAEEPRAAEIARLGPLAGLGAGVRRVDVELR